MQNVEEWKELGRYGDKGLQILKACKTGIYQQKAIVRDGQRETIWRILILDPIKSIKQAMKDVLLKGKKMVCFIFSPCFRVAVAVSNGNMELPLMRQCMDHALTLDNRVCKFTVMTVDCPGEISKLLETLAREEARQSKRGLTLMGTIIYRLCIVG